VKGEDFFAHVFYRKIPGVSEASEEIRDKKGGCRVAIEKVAKATA
jgi:hypothetical protein